MINMTLCQNGTADDTSATYDLTFQNPEDYDGIAYIIYTYMTLHCKIQRIMML